MEVSGLFCFVSCFWGLLSLIIPSKPPVFKLGMTHMESEEHQGNASMWPPGSLFQREMLRYLCSSGDLHNVWSELWYGERTSWSTSAPSCVRVSVPVLVACERCHAVIGSSVSAEGGWALCGSTSWAPPPPLCSFSMSSVTRSRRYGAILHPARRSLVHVFYNVKTETRPSVTDSDGKALQVVWTSVVLRYNPDITAD